MNKLEVPDCFIYQFQIDQKIVSSALEKFLSLKEYWHEIRNFNGVLRDPVSIVYLEKEKKLFSFYDTLFYDEIYKCLNEVCSLHFVNQKLSIVDSWWTITKKGQQSIIHDHANSLFSGVVYFENSNTDIEFIMEDAFAKTWSKLFKPESSLKKIFNKITVKPTHGKILIWPSDIPHQICLHQEENIRYSFAFNTWLDGEISVTPAGLQKVNIATNYFYPNE